jgi:threonine/homoserine/homoserine lactone efflux protein
VRRGTLSGVPSAATLLVFVGVVAMFAAVPGPAVLYIVTRSVDQGRPAGLASALGVATGAVVHVVAAALGLSVLLARSATAFSVVKVAGGCYLIWLGLRRLLARREGDDVVVGVARDPVGLRRVYTQGVVVNVLNPKTALFFLAFLPQFVESGNGPAALQVFVLGVVFIAVALASDSTYAVVASAVADRIRRGRRTTRRVERASGAVYVGLGVLALTTSHRPTTS